MSEISRRIHDLGNLHDCVIRLIEIVPEDEVLRVHIEDLLAPFRNRAEGEEGVPATIEFTGVFGMVLSGRPAHFIGEMQVDDVYRGFATSILLNSGDRINVHSAGLTLTHGPLPDLKSFSEGSD